MAGRRDHDGQAHRHHIAATDVSKAKQFYVDILGLDIVMDQGWTSPARQSDNRMELFGASALPPEIGSSLHRDDGGGKYFLINIELQKVFLVDDYL